MIRLSPVHGFKNILIVFFICACGFSQAQVEINFPEKSTKDLSKDKGAKGADLTGLWEAEITQLTWKSQPELRDMTGKLHVEITQMGNKVKGLMVCRAKFANNQGYLSFEKEFTGRWDGEQLLYQDESINNYINTHRSMRHIESCMKTAHLDFYRVGNEMHLKGDWQGVGHVSDIPCSPGSIHLKKIDEEMIESEVATTYNVNFSQKNRGPVELKWDENKKIKKIKNRNVKKGEEIKVKSKSISITVYDHQRDCLLYTSPSPRDRTRSRMPSSA